jgi:hypothetical protein
VIALYKVGICAGLQIVPNTPNRISAIELVLKGFVDVEVLPSRILLYGADSTMLEDFRIDMINHPWPTRANFLHFPKVVILPPDSVVSGVSQAGSNELTVSKLKSPERNIPVREIDKTPHQEQHMFEEDKEEVEEDKEEVEEEDEEEDITEKESEEDVGIKEKREETEFPQTNTSIDTDNQKEIHEEGEESNVRVVTPEEIGFHSNEDIIEMGKPTLGHIGGVKTHVRDFEFDDTNTDEIPKNRGSMKPSRNIVLSVMNAFSLIFSGIVKKFRNMRHMILVVLSVGLVFLGLICWMSLTVFPHVSITLTVTPKLIESTSSAVIDSTVKTTDEKTLTIQGETLEKTVSGEKTISVTGKKNVGDPAKGTVSIYNKTLSPRTFSKGSVISTKNLQFTLDDDVQIASATESIGSITFGKGTVAVTAVAIGTQGNISIDNEFSFKDVGDSVAIARNEQAFSGGTSKEVTVVSRVDQENLVAQITPELIEKAKQELSAGVVGSKKLIEETVKTTVSEKSFTEELNQETSELHGNVSMKVSGIAYDEKILKETLYEKAKTTVPTGYELLPNETTVTIGKMTVRKNGTIAVVVSLNGKAKPFLNGTELKKMIAGKNTTESIKILRALTGVSDVVTQFSYALFKQTIPKESNITITIKE